MEKLILIKYGELTTKKGNRKLFINQLKNNIKKQLPNDEIISEYSRMYIKTDNLTQTINILKKTYGIHAFVYCMKIETDIELIKQTITSNIEFNKYKTFKIETKRSDKTYPIKSMELNNIIGDYILGTTNLKVDIHNPELRIRIEIRNNGTYIYTDQYKGLGGYPVGVQGKGLLMLSGGIDSPVAGYLTLKRGVALDCLYFDSPPHTSEAAKNKVIKLTSIINQYSGNIRLFVINFTKIQEEIFKTIPESYGITIMRRMMYRIAEQVALKNKSKIIVNGESIGQVASQTLTSMSVINEVVTMPVIRPLACFDKLEIIDIAEQIETYETSILPFEDCCTVFVPKHPVINPILDKAIEYENRFNYQELIDESVNTVETITKFTDDFEGLI